MILQLQDLLDNKFKSLDDFKAAKEVGEEGGVTALQHGPCKAAGKKLLTWQVKLASLPDVWHNIPRFTVVKPCANV